MKTAILIILSLLLGCAEGIAQSKQNTSPQDYRDFVLDGDQIWALTKSGNFKVFDIDSEAKVEQNLCNGGDIALLVKDALGSIVIVDNNHHIKRYLSATKSWTDVTSFEGMPLNLVFNSDNEAFLVTDQGIVDLAGKKIYKPKMDSMSVAMRLSPVGGWEHGPSTCFIDTKDNIWLGFNFGEWGGDLYVFNTHSKQLRSLKNDSSHVSYEPVHSIFEADGKTYVTAGTTHLGGYGGRIAVFENYRGKKLFNSSQTGSGMNVSGKLYVGAAAYNLQDNSIYFYSQNGLFKGNLSVDLSKKEYWKKVFDADLLTRKCRDTEYERIDLRKIRFSNSGKLIFLSQNNKIGIYNGKTIKLLH